MKFRFKRNRQRPMPVIAVPECNRAQGRPKVHTDDESAERGDARAQSIERDRAITEQCERVAEDLSRSLVERPLADYESEPRPILRRRAVRR